MNQQHTIPVGPSHIELKVEMHAPDIPGWLAEKRWKELGNPIFDVESGGKYITAVHQVEKVDYGEAEQGELVWACDGCGAYSKSEKVVIEHEQVCDSIKKDKR